ncbi:hypothetical protein [Azospirillum doebereinerae]
MSLARIALMFAGLFLLSVVGAAVLVALVLTDDGAWTRARLERLSDWNGLERPLVVPPGRE